MPTTNLRPRSAHTLVLKRMRRLVDQWQQRSDARAAFIQCYSMMTENMITALANGEFEDPVWVDRLLRHFANYYFTALKEYTRDPKTAPQVWSLAFDQSSNSEIVIFQHLLLGVNAHINYDLVLALNDILAPNWSKLSDLKRQERRKDYDHVNRVITNTIDAVQDQIVDRAIPAMWLVDKVMGPTDEWLISHLLTHWRDAVWQKAIALVETKTQRERATLQQQVEADTLKRGQAILLHEGWFTLRDLF